MKLDRLLWIRTRTPLHVGSGSSTGVIDMPIQREHATRIPIIPGSGLKGAFRDLWENDPDTQRFLFGSAHTDEALGEAGALIISEARTLCLPLRSGKGAFAWVVSPLGLNRLARERGAPVKLPPVSSEKCFAGSEVMISTENNSHQVVLEDCCLSAEPIPPEVSCLLGDLIRDDPVWKTLPERLVLVDDEIFSYFCERACEVQQRIKLDPETGTTSGKAGNLFNQENLPSETLLVAQIGEREDGVLSHLSAKLEKLNHLIQIGGDISVGLGFCTLCLETVRTQEDSP